MSGVFLIVVLATVLAVSACGKKGDPDRPGAKTEEKTDG